MWYYAFRKHKLVTAKQIQETKRKEERGMPETWMRRYCYRDKSGQVVVVSKTVKRPRWPGRPRHKGRGKVYGQARG